MPWAPVMMEPPQTDQGGGLGELEGSEWAGGGVIGGSAAADFVLRALNVLRPCLHGEDVGEEGAEEEEEGTYGDEGVLEGGGAFGFGAGLSGEAGAPGADAWASSDEEEVDPAL